LLNLSCDSTFFAKSSPFFATGKDDFHVVPIAAAISPGKDTFRHRWNSCLPGMQMGRRGSRPYRSQDVAEVELGPAIAFKCLANFDREMPRVLAVCRWLRPLCS